MNSEIEVVECGVHYRHRPGFKVDRPQGIENFVFVLVHTPVRICQCGKESVEPAGSCFLFAPHVGYWYSDTGGEFDNTWFHARGTGVKKLIHHLKLPLNRVVSAQIPRLNRVLFIIANRNGCYELSVLRLD